MRHGKTEQGTKRTRRRRGKSRLMTDEQQRKLGGEAERSGRGKGKGRKRGRRGGEGGENERGVETKILGLLCLCLSPRLTLSDAHLPVWSMRRQSSPLRNALSLSLSLSPFLCLSICICVSLSQCLCISGR